MMRPIRRSLAPLAVALIALAAHLATLGRYGYYRDELYFLACAKRLAWGFADQPPLAPLLAASSLASGDSLFSMRLAPALAAFGAILAAAALARELGAGRLGVCVTAIAVALMPGSLFLGNTLTTTSLEPLTWTLTVLFAVKLSRDPRGRWWIGILLAGTLAAYMKYSIFLLFAALAIGGALVRERRLALLLLTAGAGASVLLGPNLAWQAAHGFPMAAVLHGDITGRHAFNEGPQYEFSGTLANAPAFLVEQLLFTNPLASPLWIAGVVALFRLPQLRPARFLGAGYVLLLAAALALTAKGYYLIGIYPALLAAGSVALDRWTSRVPRAGALALFTVSGLLLAPVAIPLLPVNALISYMHAYGAPNHLVQPLFADEFGWQPLTGAVARAYNGLPTQTRARTPVFADTYAVAAALERYGPRYGLPQPLSAQNQYYLWGPREHDLSRMLVVGASQYATLKTLYRNVRLLALFSDPYRQVIEGPTPIYLCSQPLIAQADIWRRLRWFGA